MTPAHLSELKRVAQEYSRHDVADVGGELPRFTPATVLSLLARIEELEGESRQYERLVNLVQKSVARGVLVGAEELERFEAIIQPAEITDADREWAVQVMTLPEVRAGTPNAPLSPEAQAFLDADVPAWKARAQAAEAQVERLKAGLTYIAHTWLDGDRDQMVDPPYSMARETARSTLLSVERHEPD